MTYFFMSVAVLATTALATIVLAKVSIECSFLESPGTHHCFGAEGELLLFHLSYTANTSILFKDGKQRILETNRQGKVTLNEEYANQSESINNGEVKLGKAMKKHSGCYSLEEFDHHRRLLKNVKVYLKIQAPVSKLALSQTCLSPEQMKVSCFSEGDGVQFILTLDGQFLMQSKDQSLSNGTAENSTVSNVTINLHGKRTGKIMCHVWNNVSRDEAIIHLSACQGFVTTLTVTVTTAMLFVIVVLSVIIKKFCRKSRPTNVNEGNFQDEIVYTDVRVIRNAK